MQGATNDQECARGRSPSAWENDLEICLERHDHDGLHAILNALREEIRAEIAAVDRQREAPRLERLVEQARRVLQAEPTAQEQLQDELGAERRLWATFRRRYRDAFVPPALTPFVASCAVFLAPTRDGVQFEGFAKYAGTRETEAPQPGAAEAREAVTLFARADGEREGDTPANFLTRFDRRQQRFTVLRAYRTFLPRGAGAACLGEQLATLVASGESLAEFVFDNVQNRATYAAHVEGEGSGARLRDGVGPADTPLGRLAGRLLAARGLVAGEARPVLDGFGFLDLRLTVVTG